MRSASVRREQSTCHHTATFDPTLTERVVFAGSFDLSVSRGATYPHRGRMSPRSNNIIAILSTAAVAGAFITFKTNRSFSMSHWTDAGQIRDSLMQSYGNMSLSTGIGSSYDASSLINGLSSVNISSGTMMTALQRTAEHLQKVTGDILDWAGTSTHTNAVHALSPLLLSAHHSDTSSTVEGQGGGNTTVDGVWELPNSIGTFREGALPGVSLEEAGLPSYVRNRHRDREYSRLATADTPWGLSFYDGAKTVNPGCVPDMHSCDCNEKLANRSVCSEVAHRQKPLLYIASDFLANKITTYDCPTVRCIVSPPRNYSGKPPKPSNTKAPYYLKQNLFQDC